MGQKHVHAEILNAIADGQAVQEQPFGTDEWFDMADGLVSIAPLGRYRVKPAKVYPVTGMTDFDLNASAAHGEGYMHELRLAANAALRHAIDSHDLVDPKTYMDDVRAHAARRNTARDMAIAKAVEEAVTNEWKCCGSIPLYDLAAIIASVKD